jgi:hypothetical protein
MSIAPRQLPLADCPSPFAPHCQLALPPFAPLLFAPLPFAPPANCPLLALLYFIGNNVNAKLN